MSGQIAIGVDLGGTAFKVGLLDVQGKLVAETEYPTPVVADPGQILGEISQKAMALAQSDAPGVSVAGIGIGIPGPVDPQSGIIKQCPNLHALDGSNAVEILKKATGLPAFIGNDAFCATLAELRHGAGRGCRYMALLTLGTGVGGGIAIENRVLRGPRQILGEVGHLVIEPGGPKCGCGNHGCLEALTGRQAICDRAIMKLQRGRISRLADAVGAEHEQITPRLIADLAREGDALCQEVMDEVGYYLGLAICDIIVLCDPDRILLGGGISGAGETLFGSIRRTVRHVSRISRFDPENIVAAELGNQAGMVGAGSLVWENQPA
ncbi:MAG: ROK family protein [Bacteroidota bacterium]